MHKYTFCKPIQLRSLLQWLLCSQFIQFSSTCFIFINKQYLTHTLSENTEELPQSLHKLLVAADFWSFNEDRLGVFFLPSLWTALHAEARCDRGNVTYNTPHRPLLFLINISWGTSSPLFNFSQLFTNTSHQSHQMTFKTRLASPFMLKHYETGKKTRKSILMHPVCNSRMPDDWLLKLLVFGIVERERRSGWPV